MERSLPSVVTPPSQERFLSVAAATSDLCEFYRCHTINIHDDLPTTRQGRGAQHVHKRVWLFSPLTPLFLLLQRLMCGMWLEERSLDAGNVGRFW